MATHRQQRDDGPPIAEGAIFGAIAFVVGYLVTLVVVAVGEAEEFSDDLIESAGWLYYNAQFADLDLSVEGGDEAGSESVNYLRDESLLGEALGGPEVSNIIYHLIPVVVLVAAGFALAQRVDARETGEAAVAGATLAIGAVGLALIGTFLFSLEESFLGVTIEMSPALIDGVVLVGVLYPAVFGAIGGVLSTQV